MATQKKSKASLALFWLGLLCAAGMIAFAFKERSFYLLSTAERALHPDFDRLRSAGKIGLNFGLGGTLLIFLNLLYLIRRHYINADWAGSLRAWMALHVLTGLIGSGMVLLHSAFVLRSALGALASIALLVVVATGLIGRYIYARVPRSVEGKELELSEIRERLTGYLKEMEKIGLKDAALESEMAGPERQSVNQNLYHSLYQLIQGNREIENEYALIREKIQSSSSLRAFKGSLLPLVERFCRERQWLKRYNDLRLLMSSWRFFHRWFAIVMLAMVFFHILVAVEMGNLSIFRAAP